MTLTDFYQLKNTKVVAQGFERLASTAGAFVVLEECSYAAPNEVARFNHNGTAGDRSNAFSCAMTRARTSQNYSGAMVDYNVSEETE